MPAYITHSLLGSKVIKQLPHPRLRELLERYPVAFDWGTQGPDLLFFYHAYLYPFNKVIRSGIKMHQMEIPPLLNAFLHGIKRRQRKEEKEICIAYFMGFITHYVLDRTAHPYVYATVKEREKVSSSFEKRGLHHQIESAIDSVICQRQLGIQAKNYPLFLRLKTPDVQRIIVKLLQEVIECTLDTYLSFDQLMVAFRDTLRCENFLLDSKGNYRSVAAVIDHILVRSNILEAMIKPQIPPFDIMNEEGRLWRNLDNPQIESRESFFQLYERAAKESVELLVEAFIRLERKIDFPFYKMASFDNGSGRNIQ